jgi:hypothetical protein
MANTIEEGLLEYQASKSALGKGSMERVSKKDLARAKLTALDDLFQIEDEKIETTTWDLDDFIADDDDENEFF